MYNLYPILFTTRGLFLTLFANIKRDLSIWKSKNHFPFVLTIACLLGLFLASLSIEAMPGSHSKVDPSLKGLLDIKNHFNEPSTSFAEVKESRRSGLPKAVKSSNISTMGSCLGNDPAGQTPVKGLYAEYYAGDFSPTNNQTFFTTNTPTLIRTDTTLNFPTGNFGNILPPASGNVAAPTHFSARFRGSISVSTAGTYTFYLTSDDAGFLWLDNAALEMPALTSHALINNAGNHGAKTIEASVYLPAGSHNMLIHFGQGSGPSKLVLEYAGPGLSRQVIPKSVLCTSVQPALTSPPASASYSPNAATIPVNTAFNSLAPVVYDAGAPITQYVLDNASILPNGISISASGVIRANATVPIGTYVLDVSVANANGTLVVSNAFTLTVAPPVNLAGCSGKDPADHAPIAAIYAEYYAGYFNNNHSFFNSPPALVRYEGRLNYTNNFGGNPLTPIAGTLPEYFSARYRTSIYIPTAGTYTFYLTSDDASYLWLDAPTMDRPAQTSRAVIDNGGGHGAIMKQASRYLSPGMHNILIHYGNGILVGKLLLEYSGPGMARKTISASDLCTSVQKLFAISDSYSTDFNTALVGTSVLANDIDSTKANLPLQLTLITGPQHGTITLNPNGTFNYVPVVGFIGLDSLTYQICSSGSPGYCAQAAVSIAVNDPDYTRKGKSLPVAAGCFQLTGETTNQTSAVWWKQSINLNNSFDLRFDAHFSALGKINDAGGDGLVFVLQNKGNSLSPTSSGSSLGYGGISPSLGIEFDTYNNNNPADIAADHTSVLINGETATTPAMGPFPMKSDASNVEDGLYHAIRIVWSKPDLTLRVYFDNELRLTYEDDIIKNIFNGNSLINWGFTASTGGVFNEQGICSLVFTPINDAPLAVNDTFTINEDSPLQGSSLLINDSDPNGNSLTVKVIPITAPSKGTVTLQADGTFVYTPNPDANGSDSFVYQVCDNGSPSLCNQSTVSITITPINDPPVAVNDSYITDEDTPLTISVPGVLANDTDIEAVPLKVRLVAVPAKGTLALNADGSFTYTPKPDYNGTDRFTYQASDESLSSNIATVTLTINPVNDAPIAADDEVDTWERIPIIIQVLANDTDVDGLNLTSQIKTMPQFGQVIHNNDGSFTYKSEKNYHGTDVFVYQICDNATPNLCAEATVTIRIGQTIDETVVYQGISPNGDNQNDFWFIDHIDDYPQNTVRIFNRWGNLVFEVQGYDNEGKVWAGETNQGSSMGSDHLPDGTYFYVLNLGDGSAPKKGYLVINR